MPVGEHTEGFLETPVAIPPLPEDATPEEKDMHWYKFVYQGDKMPQLTWRAVLMGGILGMLMSAANLYTTLSIGWAFGIAITACVLSFVVWNFVRLFAPKNISQMSVLENACMASTASAAGYSTGSTIATMFGALVLLRDPPEGVQGEALKQWAAGLHTWDVTKPWVVVTFTLCTGLMGVFLAIPMKRQQINHEQLPFPSGIAAAETLRSLYSASKDAITKAYALVVALAAGLLIGFLRVGDDVLDAVGFLKRLFEKIAFLHIPEKLDMRFLDRLYPGMRHAAGFAFEPSALLIAAGMIVGMRISLSLVLSSLLLYGVVGPKMAEVDAAHMAKGADVVLVAVKDAAKDKTDPAAVSAAALAAMDKAVDDLKVRDAGAIKGAGKDGAKGALAEIEKAKGEKEVGAIVAAAKKAGLPTERIEKDAKRAGRDAADGPDKARSGAALAAAERLAKAANVDAKPIVEAAATANKEAAAAADKAAGAAILAAVLDAAQKEHVDVTKVRAAADEASAKEKTSPGLVGAAAARETAGKILYEELENDPAPIGAAADKATEAATAEASKNISNAVIAAVTSEATKLRLDTAAILASADAAAKVAAEGEGKAMTAAAIETASFEAAQAKADASAFASAAGAVTFTEEESKENVKKVVKGINGAAGVAAINWGNDAAIAAREETKAKFKAEGKTYKKTKEAADAAFEAAKYHKNFIWDWAGEEVTITRWALWGGTAVMVFSSLMSVALQWRTIVRAFMGVKASAKDGGGLSMAGMQEIEVPGSWMVVGMLPITIAMVWLQIQAFGVSWYAGLIAVAMSFVLSLVASRATGETDTTPIGAMGKVMQLMFAVLAKKNLAANLASAGIAANSASASADLLTDLKTGYLLGANPRRQFLAQFFGVFFGTIAIVPIWYLMVPTRAKLETFALPSTRAWEAVARILVKGVGELPVSAIYSIFIGAAIGVILPVVERVLPPKARKYMPSATGIGLAWVMPFQNAFSFFVGSVITMLWMRAHKKTAEHYNVAIASGLIAGESLMAAALAITATVVGLLAASGS